MSKRALFIAAGIIVLLFAVAGPLKRWLANASVPTSVYAFTPAEIETSLQKIEATLPEIEKLLADHRYQPSRELFDTTFYPLRRSLRVVGDPTLGADRTLSSELKRLEARVGEAARRDFESLVAKIAQGGTDTATVHRLVRSFANVGGNKLDEDLTARSAGLDKIRRTFATRWIRISIATSEDDYEAMTLAHMLQTLVAPPGFTLVFGPPMGPAEEAATFATVDFKIAVNVQAYDVKTKEPGAESKNTYFHNRSSDGLLSGVAVSILVHKAFDAYPTTWDQLPGKAGDGVHLVLDLPVPGAFEFKVPRGRTAHDEFKDRNVARVAAMKTKLAAALAALPVLEFKSTGNPPASPLSRENALFNEASFAQAATASLAAKKSVGEIACIAVELMLEPLADRIDPQLEKFTAAERLELTKALEVRPWYHGYSTLNKLMSSAPAENVPSLLAAMQRDLDQASVLKTALVRISREKDSREQSNMLALLVGYTPKESLPDFVRLYPNLGPALQSTLLTSLMKRDRAITAEFAQQLIETSKPAVVQQVCEALGNALTSINSARMMVLTPEEIAIFRQAVATTRGTQREQIIGKIPRSEELLMQLLQSDRAGWTEAENLELYSQFSSFDHHAARDTQIMGEVFKAVKEGRLKSAKLAQKASGVLSVIANAMLRTRGDEDVKIPLILQVIDERSRPNAEICAQSIVSMFVTLDPANVLKHPDARALLVKAKAYGSETGWAKILGPHHSSPDFPGERFRKKIVELTTAAANADPSYRDLL